MSRRSYYPYRLQLIVVLPNGETPDGRHRYLNIPQPVRILRKMQRLRVDLNFWRELLPEYGLKVDYTGNLEVRFPKEMQRYSYPLQWWHHPLRIPVSEVPWGSEGETVIPFFFQPINLLP